MHTLSSLHGDVVDGSLTRSLRARVLRLTPTRPEEWLPGDDEEDQLIHFGVIDKSAEQSINQSSEPFILSTCFIYPEACDWLSDHRPAYHLRQMATEPTCRSRGAGAAVIDAVVEWMRKQAHNTTRNHSDQQTIDQSHSQLPVRSLLWCYAREPAMAFYMKQGFECVGDVFISEKHLNIPHIRMQKWVEH